jgi:hypothetical protein
MEQQLELTKATGKPFMISIEIRPNNDDCPCALCQARRDLFAAYMNRPTVKILTNGASSD